MKYLVSTSAAVVLAFGSIALGGIGDPPSWDGADYDFGQGKDSFAAFFTTSVTETQDADSSMVGGDTGQSWYSVAPAAVPAAPFTWEFRAALPPGSNLFNQTRPGLNGGPSSKDVVININPAAGTYLLTDGATSAANASTITVPAGWDSSAMNIYRVVVETDGTADLYLNNDPTSAATFSPRDFHPGGDHGFQIGSSTSSGPTQYDYMRLASGAYVPAIIPEPASLAILSLGGLMLLRRRQ